MVKSSQESSLPCVSEVHVNAFLVVLLFNHRVNLVLISVMDAQATVVLHEPLLYNNWMSTRVLVQLCGLLPRAA